MQSDIKWTSPFRLPWASLWSVGIWAMTACSPVWQWGQAVMHSGSLKYSLVGNCQVIIKLLPNSYKQIISLLLFFCGFFFFSRRSLKARQTRADGLNLRKKGWYKLWSPILSAFSLSTNMSPPPKKTIRERKITNIWTGVGAIRLVHK